MKASSPSTSTLSMTSLQDNALRLLRLEYNSLIEEPLESFRVTLPDRDNWFEWDLIIFGPTATIYQGGYFKARLLFPHNYPFNPPTLHFDPSTHFVHPNVDENGDLRSLTQHWDETQTARTVLLSIVSLLIEPNLTSPANTELTEVYRRWKESDGQDSEYVRLVGELVAASRLEAERDSVILPENAPSHISHISHQSHGDPGHSNRSKR